MPVSMVIAVAVIVGVGHISIRFGHFGDLALFGWTDAVAEFARP